MGLFPKKIDFFDLFSQASLDLIKAARSFTEIIEHIDDCDEHLKALREFEKEGDLLTQNY